jgi:xanthine dehydrogenase small subunit
VIIRTIRGKKQIVVTLKEPISNHLTRFILNNKNISTDLPQGNLLVDFIRYDQNLKGTKIGCREGDCGACVVLVGDIKNGELVYKSLTSCLTPLANVHNKHVVTIEGINMERLNPIQQAMIDESATQCGFCTPGFVVSFAGFCLSKEKASRKNAIACVDGNICRCTGYKSIERTAGRIATFMESRGEEEPSGFVAANHILPSYFTGIKERLQQLISETNGELNREIVGGFISGGTDLYVQKHDELKNAKSRYLLNHSLLKGIYKDGNKCVIGGSSTVTDLAESTIMQECFPRLHNYIKLISSTPIRNIATVAGNFINASPIGDLTIFFLALNATIVLSDGRNNREVLLRKLYKGYKTLNKMPDEYIEKIWFAVPDNNTCFHFEKVSKRIHLDIATVNSAISITMVGGQMSEVYLSAGGVAPVPLFLERTSSFLKAKAPNKETILEAIEILQTEITPISDVRGTEEYKRLLLGQLFKAHFIELFNLAPVLS